MSGERTIDLVVVGFTGDLRLLELQARSLRRHAADAFDRLVYVINERNARQFKRAFEQCVIPELGSLANRTLLIDGSDLAGEKLRRANWRSQQSLKLLAARKVQAHRFLVLDGKNHFIRPVERGTFLSSTGRLRTHRYELNEKLRKNFKNACAYFDVEFRDVPREALPTSPPFLMDRATVCALLDEVEAKEGIPFHRFFNTSGDFTEFYFYFAYLLSRPGLLDQLYETRTRAQVTLFRSAADDPARVKTLLPVIDRKEVYCFGVHRTVLEASNPDTNRAIANVWQRFGLTESDEESAYFLQPQRLTGWRKFWPF